MITKTVYKNVESVENAKSGIIFEYETITKNGDKILTRLEFTGSGFVPESNDAQSCFRAWKKLICLYWDSKAEEQVVRADNGGIALKLRGTTPTRAIIKGSDFEYAWNLSDSKWERIGLLPTKRDLEERAREYKKKMHKAAAASFAVSFGKNFKSLELKEEEA